MKYIIRGGRRNGEVVEADYQFENKLFKKEYASVQNTAADGNVMISKVCTESKLIYEAAKDEIIEELE